MFIAYEFESIAIGRDEIVLNRLEVPALTFKTEEIERVRVEMDFDSRNKRRNSRAQ